MRFQEKLMLVGLALLVFTLVLSSLLSLASFEKIYSRALIKTYEVSGKNLQRNIEASLRFGKPLSGFVAMDSLLAKVREADPVIMRIDVVGSDKTLLYSTGDLERGRSSPYAELYPEFQGPDAPPVHTLQIEKRYVTFLPLRNKRNEIQGYLNLEFGRDQVNSQLQTMALGNLRVLGIIIAASVLVLILLLSLGIVRPIERRLRAFFSQDSEESQDTPETLNCGDRDRDELSRIAVDVKCLLDDSRRELQAFEKEQGSKSRLLGALSELTHLNERLLSEVDDADRPQQLSDLCSELSEAIHLALGEELPPRAGKAV
jgi:hypothetical protein